jgi:F-type H+-transporting ATPase subunit gamma
LVERIFPASVGELLPGNPLKLGVPNFVEPDKARVEKEFAEHYYFLKLMYALRSSSNSEFSQRFLLMKSAVDNVKELTDELTLELNKERQRGITQELSEIIGTFKALQNK